MSLTWETTQTDHPSQQMHSAICLSTDENAIKEAIDNSLHKAISLLGENIEDDSLYFLVEWKNNSEFTIVVSDDSKQEISPSIVYCRLTIPTEKKNYFNEKIRYWTRDYLTTSNDFIHFSLVAIFSQGDRKKTELL